MDIQKVQFPQEIFSIIQHVAESHFIAFDLEFSGIAERSKVPAGIKRQKLTLQELYDEVKEAAEKYQILQVGLTIVKEEQDRSCYVVYPYNFNINPIPALQERQLGRVWSYHSGAVNFLHENGFRFDLPITHGIPYLSRKEERDAQMYIRGINTMTAALPDLPFKDEDVPLLTHVREAVIKWQSKPSDQRDDYLNIPDEPDDPALPQTLNRYQVRLTHQTVQNEFPGLMTTGMGHFVQITNPNASLFQHRPSRKEQQRTREVTTAIGFRWLMEAIMGGDISNMPDEYSIASKGTSEKHSTAAELRMEKLSLLQEKLISRRSILVGHNCFTDLVNLYRCFIGDLPAKVEDFQESVHDLFPAVVDTKYVASLCGRERGWTALRSVYRDIDMEEYPKIEVAAGFDRYDRMESYHEAGYDSLQTAKVLIKLSALMERDNKLKDKKIYPEISGRGFGFCEDYDTASESLSDIETQRPTHSQTIANAQTDPLTAMKSQLPSVSLSPESNLVRTRSNRAQAGAIVLSSKYSLQAASSVVAVKRVQTLSVLNEVNKAGSRFSSANVYDVLDGSEAEFDIDTKSHLTERSGNEKQKKDREAKKQLKKVAREHQVEDQVRNGKMMPRWDGASGFWQILGNKLQVNATAEDFCELL